MRNPKAGPAAYLLLRGEGDSEDATSPAGSASFLPASVLHSPTNACSYRVAAMTLAGIRVSDQDVRELPSLVDEPTATVLRNAVERETLIVALKVADRERIL